MNMPNVLRTVNPTIVPSQKQFTSIFKVFREPQPRSQGQQDYSRAVPAATATRTRVPLASFSDQRQTMAPSSSQVLSCLQGCPTDPDRRAGMQAGLAEPAWVKDVVKAAVEPTETDDHLGFFLGLIPNQEWLHFRSKMPNVEARACQAMVLLLWRKVRLPNSGHRSFPP